MHRFRVDLWVGENDRVLLSRPSLLILYLSDELDQLLVLLELLLHLLLENHHLLEAAVQVHLNDVGFRVFLYDLVMQKLLGHVA